MPWTIIFGWVVIAVLFALAWLAGSSADNVDARATATLLYLPVIGLAGIWGLATVIWALVRFL